MFWGRTNLSATNNSWIKQNKERVTRMFNFLFLRIHYETIRKSWIAWSNLCISVINNNYINEILIVLPSMTLNSWMDRGWGHSVSFRSRGAAAHSIHLNRDMCFLHIYPKYETITLKLMLFIVSCFFFKYFYITMFDVLYCVFVMKKTRKQLNLS